jgi:hypothetical protein
MAFATLKRVDPSYHVRMDADASRMTTKFSTFDSYGAMLICWGTKAGWEENGGMVAQPEINTPARKMISKNT